MARIPAQYESIMSPRMVYFRETDSPFVYHFCFFRSWRGDKSKGQEEGGRMRIDSSSIGMDSARKYSSFTTRVTRVAITNSRQALQGGTGGLR